MPLTHPHIIDKMTKVLLPENVNLTILDVLIRFTSEQYRKDKNTLNDILLDFSRIKYIEIEGVLSLLCFCAALKRKNADIKFHFIYPNDRVLTYLLTLGFFGQMSNKVGALEGQELVRIENELRIERRKNQKVRTAKFDSYPVILPIETINKQEISTSGIDFENMVGTFANHALDAFDILQTSPIYNFSGDDYYKFRQSNIELYKNIFHHSKSWGIASIHARPNYGTTVCYYDIGIGFKSSIKMFKTESESIEWALIDGNTSKPEGDNDGYGFTVVQEFVFKRNGKMKIRSGDCLLELNSNSSRKKTKVITFPGVQISYFIPA